MLQKIRDHVAGFVAWIIVGIIAIAFTLWGVDFGFSTRQFAAKVNDEEIGLAEFGQTYQNQLANFQRSYGEVPDEQWLASEPSRSKSGQPAMAATRARANHCSYRLVMRLVSRLAKP